MGSSGPTGEVKGSWVGPIRTIESIAGNPLRSRPWKVFDVAVISLLWALTVVSIAAWLGGGAASDWAVIVCIVPAITTVASLQCWYQHPSSSKQARAKAALETKYAELSRIHGSEAARVGMAAGPARDDIPRQPGIPSGAGTAGTRVTSPPVGGVVTLRCATVQVTGVLWTLVGVGTIVISVALLASPEGRHWIDVVIGGVGMIVCFTGLTFLHSRLTITSDSIVSVWGLARRAYPLDDLVDATLAQPFRKSNRGAGAVDWVRPGGNGLIFLFGYLLLFTFRVLAWVALPGSSSGEMLHLIQRRGGPIPVPSISTCIDRQDDSAHHALSMVRAAIAAPRNRQPS